LTFDILNKRLQDSTHCISGCAVAMNVGQTPKVRRISS